MRLRGTVWVAFAVPLLQVLVTCPPTSKRWAWFPPEVHPNTGRLCSVGSERHPVPRRQCSYAALRLPAPFSRGSGSPCQRPTSWRALVLCPRGPTTRAPAYASCAGDHAPALRNTGVSSRRGEGLPGDWTVLFVRAMVDTPPETNPSSPRNTFTQGLLWPSMTIQRSPASGKQRFRGRSPTARTFACLRIAHPISGISARLATGPGGSPLAGRISHPLDDEQKFQRSHRTSNPLRPAGPGRTAFLSAKQQQARVHLFPKRKQAQKKSHLKPREVYFGPFLPTLLPN
jgi:hypothetical protein